MDAPAPGPPELLSKLPFCSVSDCNVSKGLATRRTWGSADSRGLTPTAADPKEKLPSESVRGCSENVLKASAEPFSGGAWTKVQSQG